MGQWLFCLVWDCAYVTCIIWELYSFGEKKTGTKQTHAVLDDLVITFQIVLAIHSWLASKASSLAIQTSVCALPNFSFGIT